MIENKEETKIKPALCPYCYEGVIRLDAGKIYRCDKCNKEVKILDA